MLSQCLRTTVAQMSCIGALLVAVAHLYCLRTRAVLHAVAHLFSHAPVKMHCLLYHANLRQAQIYAAGGSYAIL